MSKKIQQQNPNRRDRMKRPGDRDYEVLTVMDDLADLREAITLANTELTTAQNELQKAVDEINPTYIIGLFSGGADSATATHLAAQNQRFSFALKIDTGIGIPETNEYVRKTCQGWGIELREYRAVDYVRSNGMPDAQIYRNLCQKWGFPGPAGHGLMFQRLKERALRHCLRDLNLKCGNRVLLVSGCRSDESVRRMANTEPLQHWEGRKWFAAPIWKFTKANVFVYMKTHDIKRNPVVDKIHKSGECLCGAFAKPGELDELRLWYPEVAEEIDNIAAEVRAAGFPWGWEESPPAWFQQHKHGQQFLPGMIPEGVLCSSCIG